MDVGSAVYAGAINCLPCSLRSGIHASKTCITNSMNPDTYWAFDFVDGFMELVGVNFQDLLNQVVCCFLLFEFYFVFL